jgi:hypothetical protein
MCRRRAHVIGLKKGWFLTSEAPAREPNLLTSSLMRSLRITDLQRLDSSQRRKRRAGAERGILTC